MTKMRLNWFQVSGFRCQQTVQQSGFMKLPFKFMRERFPTAINIDRIPLFDVRPARKALKQGRDKYKTWINDSMTAIPKSICMAGGCSTFISFFHRSNRPWFWPAAALTPETLTHQLANL